MINFDSLLRKFLA